MPVRSIGADWPGFGKMKPAHYLTAAEVEADARVQGVVAFVFACYGAGTPMVDDFAHVPGLARFSCATPRPVVARLPQHLLAHPGNVDHAPALARPHRRHANPARALVVLVSTTIPEELHLHPPEAVGEDLVTSGADDDR